MTGAQDHAGEVSSERSGVAPDQPGSAGGSRPSQADESVARRRSGWARPHALHAVPALVSAGCLIAAPILDLVGRVSGWSGLWTAGSHVLSAGAVVGVVAVASGGLAHRALPKASAARRRSARHAALTFVALALLMLARWVRGHPGVPPDPPVVAAEAIAAGLVLIASVGGFRLRRAECRRAQAPRP